MFFLLSVQLTGCIDNIIQITSGELSVMMIFVIFRHIKVNRTLAFVSISVLQDLFHQLNLFDDMSRCMRFNAGRKHVQRLHSLMIAVQVILNNFHRLQLFQTSFLCNFIFTVISIMFQMTYIGNVSYITYLIAQMRKVTEKNIECNSRTSMSQMSITINSRPAHIHAYMRSMQRNKQFLATGKRIINSQLIFHNYLF